MRRLRWLTGLLATGCLLTAGCGISVELSRPTPPEPEVKTPLGAPEEIVPEEPAVETPLEEPTEKILSEPEEPDIPPGLPLDEEPAVEIQKQD